MPARLALHNPSEYPRQGFVSVPWGPLSKAGVDARSLSLYYQSGSSLRAQVDEVDPSDPLRTVLVFELDGEVGPGPENYSRNCAYVTLAKGAPDRQEGPLVEINPNGFKLINEHLSVWFNTSSEDAEGHGWFSGSASSIQLDQMEILDNFRALNSWAGHDPEKRCMQIDRIRMHCPPWDEKAERKEYPPRLSYKVISHSAGPVRASVTIATKPFSYIYRAPLGGEEQELSCRLYRVISLYHQADYVIEELYLKGVAAGREPGPGVPFVTLAFAAHYFLYMDLGLLPSITHFEHIPDWFALGCSWSPCQGYGFATDVHARPIANPHPGFPHPEGQHKSFSWEIGLSKEAKCLHLFKRCKPQDLASEAGKAWYFHIFKPLRATFLGEETA